MPKWMRDLKTMVGRLKADGNKSVAKRAPTVPFTSIPPHTCGFCQKLIFEVEKNPYQLQRRLYNYPCDESLEDPSEVAYSTSPGVRRWRKILKESKLEGPVQLELGPTEVLWDFTLTELQHAAAKGCYLCQFLRDNCLKMGEDMKKVEFPLLAARSIINESILEFGILRFERRGYFEINDSETQVQKVTIDFNSIIHLFTVVAPADSSSARYFPVRPINTSPSSDQSLNLDREWFQKCLTEHELCRKMSTNFMPSRVLEILDLHSHNCRVRLMESSKLKESKPYAALSYCWGEKGNITTTTKNIHHHLTGLDTQHLPSTIKDAVLVTEKLGLHYLWVDALCIIQDNDHDKESEISQMASIYSQSAVTILASRARNVHQGFLGDRVPGKIGNEAKTIDRAVELPFRHFGGELGTFTLLPLTPDYLEPLEERAWTLQERFLSPRILDYGCLVTSWGCPGIRGFKAIDGFQRRGDSSFQSMMQRFARQWTDLLLSLDLPLDTDSFDIEANRLEEIRSRIMVEWREILKDYTGRKLSVPSDRLPALSGIASQFTRLLGDYHAGLWGSTLCQDLLWQVKTLEKLKSRPTQYHGPSWSWAATSNAVDFEFSPYAFDAEEVVFDFSVISCQDCMVETSYKAHSSEPLQDAIARPMSIIIRGRISPAYWKVRHNADALYSPSSRLTQKIDTELNVAQAVMLPDAFEGPLTSIDAPPSPVFLLQAIIKKNSYNGSTVHGLVLRKVSETAYSRLGLFSICRNDSRTPVESSYAEWKQRYERELEWVKNSEFQVFTLI